MWKDILGYEGSYQVSDDGLVRSLDRYVRSKNGSQCLRRGQLMKFTEDPEGYYSLGLTKDGYQKSFRVNRLVALAFIPNPDNLPLVHHKDCNKQNNCVDNLEWVTVSDNTQRAFDDGCVHQDIQKLCEASHLGVEKTRKPVKCVETGQVFYSISECRNYLGFKNSDSLVLRIVRNIPINGYHYEFIHPEDIEFSKYQSLKFQRKPPTTHNSKRVRCVETGQVFKSQVDAERQLHLPSGYVANSTHKRSTNHLGISFEFVI